jgi:hypothetical protein
MLGDSFFARRLARGYLVDLKGGAPLPWRLFLCVALSLVTLFVLAPALLSAASMLPTILSSLAGVLVFVLLGAFLFLVWRWFKKFGRRYPFPVVERMLYFVRANNLFEAERENWTDAKGRRRSQETVTVSARFLVFEDAERIVVRGLKDADKFSSQMGSLDAGLCALFGLPIENKVEALTYCEYTFLKHKAERLVVAGGDVAPARLSSNLLPLNNNLAWRIDKQPHAVIAGPSGSGKTTFLNALILSILRAGGILFIADPKNSDLSSLRHVLGSSFVASAPNDIARLVREVRELMERRFADYKDNPERFRYGASYIDYGLSPAFIVFDELGAFRAGADKKAYSETMASLTEIILKGREMGVFCTLSTQQPNANNIPTELRDQLSLRLALGNMSREAYTMVFGSVDMDSFQTVTAVGAGYIYLDGLGWGSPKPFEAPFVDYGSLDFLSEVKRLHEASEGRRGSCDVV